MTNNQLQTGEIAIYRSKDGKARLEVKLQKETLWLTQKGIAALFDVNVPAINKHLINIFKEGELKRDPTISKMEIVQKEGNRTINRLIEVYNLDAIISVGYRVNSKRATQFRIWATSVLKNHIINGYTLNQKRLQEKGLDEFEEAIGLIKRTLQSRMLTDNESKGLLEVITGYSSTWVLLQKYDKSALTEPKKHRRKSRSFAIFCNQGSSFHGRQQENRLIFVYSISGKKLLPVPQKR